MTQTLDSSIKTPQQFYQSLRDNIGINSGEMALKTLGLFGTVPYLPLLEVATGLATQYARLKRNVAVVEASASQADVSATRGLMELCQELRQLELQGGKISDYGFWDILALLSWQNRTCRVNFFSKPGSTFTLDLLQGQIVGIISRQRLFEKKLLQNLMQQDIFSVKTLQAELGQKRFDPYTLIQSLQQISSLDAKSFHLLYEKSLRETLLQAASSLPEDFCVTQAIVTESPLNLSAQGNIVAFRNLLENKGIIWRALKSIGKQEGWITIYPWGHTSSQAAPAGNFLAKIVPLIKTRHDFIVLSLPSSPQPSHPIFFKMIDAALLVVAEAMPDKSELGQLAKRLGRHTKLLGSVIASHSMFHH